MFSEVGVAEQRINFVGAEGTLRDILDQIVVKLPGRDSSQTVGNFDLLEEVWRQNLP